MRRTPPAEADDSASASEILVTGSRGQGRTIISSPTPIDVIGGQDLEKLGGGMQLRDALTQLVSSFQSTTVGSSSFNSLTRPAGLRGLSGVHVLVLVNGKRRHNSSKTNLHTGEPGVKRASMRSLTWRRTGSISNGDKAQSRSRPRKIPNPVEPPPLPKPAKTALLLSGQIYLTQVSYGSSEE